jgi:hypothetical protein
VTARALAALPLPPRRRVLLEDPDAAHQIIIHKARSQHLTDVACTCGGLVTARRPCWPAAEAHAAWQAHARAQETP